MVGAAGSGLGREVRTLGQFGLAAAALTMRCVATACIADCRSGRDISMALGEVCDRQVVQIAPHFGRSNDSLPADLQRCEAASFKIVIDTASAFPSNLANLGDEQILVSFQKL